MTDRVAVQKLATAVGQTVPGEYVEFLEGLRARPQDDSGDGPVFEYDGREWLAYSLDRLAEVIPHRRGETAFPHAHGTGRHAELLRAADAVHGGEASEGLLEQGFPLDRLARGFCIGEDPDGDLLFVDADTGGVFAYCHDGMDVEPWAGSLAELLAGSRDQAGDDDAE